MKGDCLEIGLFYPIQQILRYILAHFYPVILLAGTFLIILPPKTIKGQGLADKYDLNVTGSYHPGKVIQHNSKFNGDLVEDPAHFGEFSLSAQTNGSEYWHQLLNYPEGGLVLLGGSFGNRDELGFGYGAVPFVKFRLHENKIARLFFRMGIGVGVVTEPYDPIENPANNAIGSKVNNIAQFVFGLDWKLNNQWHLRTAASYTHFSNGRVQHPNLGVNTPAGVVGLRYHFSSNRDFHKFDTIPQIKKRWRFHVKGAMAAIERRPPGGPKYPVYIGSAFVSWKTGHTNRLFAGATVEYRTGTYDFVVIQEIFEPKNRRIKSYNGSIFFGDELLVGDVGLSGRIGYYMYNPILQGANIYAKLGITYYVPIHFLGKRTQYTIGINLKSHYAVADYISLSTGFAF